MPKFSTILFDLDHTLMDSDASEDAAFASTLEQYGVSNSSQHRATYNRINRALWDRVELGEIGPDFVKIRRFEELVSALDLNANPENMAEAFANSLAQNGELYPGVINLLTELAESHVLGLITNGLCAVQRKRVRRLGLESIFSAIVISEEVGHSKPDPEIFDAIFEELGNPKKSDVVIVGDSLSSDVAGGRAYGITTIWYNRSGAVPALGDAYTHEITILADLLSLVS